MCCDARFDYQVKPMPSSICWFGSLMFYLFYLYLITYTGVKYGFHRCLCRLEITHTTVVTSGTGTANYSGATALISIVCGVLVSKSLVFCVVLCKSLFVPFFSFILAILLCVLLRYTTSNYSFHILKLF